MSTPSDPLRAALFDLDGTLLTTRIDFPAMAREMNALAASAGVPPEVVAVSDVLGKVRTAADYLAAQKADPEAYRRRAFEILEELEVLGCADSVPVPHAEELLLELRRRGVGIGIVTRNSRRVSAPMLSAHRMLYDVLLTRDDVDVTKPDPRHLWQALASLGRCPGDAVMVGDHAMDVAAGRAAGCAATVRTMPASLLKNDMDATLTTSDLRDVLLFFGGK